MSAIRIRIAADEIRFEEWGDDIDLFVRKIEGILGVKAKKRRFLIFIVRYDFVMQGESVLLAVDEDGTAYIGFSKNSAAVRQAVIEKFKQSSEFCES